MASDSEVKMNITVDENTLAEKELDQTAYLRKEIKRRILEYSYPRRPLNILLIGPKGVGKSTFLLSAITALRNEWAQYVWTGHGGGGETSGSSSVTHFLRRVNILRPNGPEVEVEDEAGADAEVARLAPRFIDVAGLPDENTPLVREIIRRLLYGAIPEKESLSEVYRMGVLDGLTAVRAKYGKKNKNLAIDRLLVVTCAGETLNRSLTVAAMEAARVSGIACPDDGIHYRRAVPVYGLVMKVDKVGSMNSRERETFDSMVSSFSDLMVMRGAEHRLAKCVGYCGETTKMREGGVANHPAIDKRILEFLYILLDTNIPLDNDEDDPYTREDPGREDRGREEPAGAQAGPPTLWEKVLLAACILILLLRTLISPPFDIAGILFTVTVLIMYRHRIFN